MKNKIIVFLALSLICCASVINAVVIVSTSCGLGAVQAAVDAASDGDTVQMPVGISTWTAGLRITNKAITVRGMGIEQTIIIDGTPASAPYPGPDDPFMITGAPGKPWRLSNFTLMGVQTDVGGVPYAIDMDGLCSGWRIDHMKFYDLGHTIDAYMYGLVDHCTFYVSRKVTSGGAIGAIGIGADTGDSGSWSRPLSLGTSAALYIEDCYFHFNDINFANII